MIINYKTKGTCSKRINVTLVDDIITELSFEGGCDGSSKAIAFLAIGKTAKEVAILLKGIDCEGRGTSCPDQLAKALEEALV